MTAKRHRRVVVPVQPPDPQPGNLGEPFYRSILTDREGNFDAGAVLTVIVVIYMCMVSGYSTMTIGVAFDPQAFGTGVGACLVGLAAYRWGDRPRQGTTTTYQRTETSAAKTTERRDRPID